MESNDTQWNTDKFKVIDSDGLGYYAYLPSTFLNTPYQGNLDHELNFDSNPVTQSNKYFLGTSLLETPFFIIAHGYASLHNWISPSSKFLPNGYSFPYHIAILFSGVFYLIIGLIFIKKTAVNLGIKRKLILPILAIFALGCQLFILSSYEASLAHIYAFSIISALLFYWNRFTKNPDRKSYLMLFFLISILGLIRPTDVLIILVFPVFLVINGNKVWLEWMKKQRMNHFFGLLIGLSVLLVQLTYWKLQSGSFFIWSYGNEGFDFSSPEIFNMLFSYKKGLFIYTPIIFIALVFIVISRIKWSIKLWFSIFFLVNTYVISSWWCWFYGGSYGMRPWIDFLPIIILVLILAIQTMNQKVFRLILFGLIILCVPYNLIQTYQYTSQIMHYDSMNKAKFWQIFMRTDDTFKFVTYDQPEYYSRYELIQSKYEILTNNEVHSVNKRNQRFKLIKTVTDSIFYKNEATYLKVSFDGKIDEMNKSANLYWIRTVDDGNQDFQNAKVISFIRKSDEWQKAEIILDICQRYGNEIEFELGFYNDAKNNFQFKNIRIDYVNYVIPDWY